MKSKHRPSRARVSKIPLKPSSMASRALNEMVNVNDVDASHQMENGDNVDGSGRGGPYENTEELGQPAPAKRLKRCVIDVQEAHRDESRDDIRVDETKDDSEPSIVPETPGYSDGCHDNATPDSSNVVMANKAKHIFSSSPSTLNWDSLTTLDWTEQGLCIMCNKGDQVLICGSDDCPLAVHESCLGSPPSFDDMGDFYCPLCSYKRALSESHEVKKEVVLAKKKVHLARDSCSLFLNGSCHKQPAERILRKELNQSGIAENLGTIHDNRQQREIASEKSVGVVEEQRVAEEVSGCINENLRVKTSLVSKGNDASLSREGDHAKQVGSNQCKNVESQNEAQAAVRCTNGNIVAEISQITKVSDVPTRGDHGELGDSVQHKNDEDLQEVVAAVGCTNTNLRVETSFVTERSCAGHHAKEVNGRHCFEHHRKADFREDSTQLSELFDHPQTLKKGNGTGMVIEHQCISDAEQYVHLEANVRVGTSNSPCRDSLSGGPQNYQKRNVIETVDEFQRVSEAEQHVHSEANIGFETSNSPCRDIETVTVHAECRASNTVVQPNIVDPPQKSSSKPSVGVEENAINLNEEKITSSNSEKRYKSDKRSSNPALPNSRRKKLLWTFEEEEMLKKAVQKFSDKTGKKFSWRNILEFGCNVFNESRTPVDLKDKWRNMTKEGSRARLG